MQCPENSVEKFSFPPGKISEALLEQREPPAQSLAGATEVSPCSGERQGKQRATLPEGKNSSVGEGYLVLVLVIFTICRTDGASL